MPESDTAPETARKPRNAGDAELTAIQGVLSALSDLRPEARSRVVDYVFKRLGLMSEGVPIGSPTSEYSLPTPGDIVRSGPPKDIRSLSTEKAPQSAIEMAAVVAYYLSELAPLSDRKAAINADDIKRYFKQAHYPLPSSPQMTLVHAKNSGYLEPAGPGLYKLNPVGYNLVMHALPFSKESPRKKKKARTRSSQKRGRA